MQDRLCAMALRVLWDEGPVVFAHKSAAKLGLRHLLLFELTLPAPHPVRQSATPVSFRILQPNDLDLLLASQPEVGRERAGWHWGLGRVCHAAIHDGRVVASEWVARDLLSDEWMRLQRALDPDEAYSFACHTAAEFRGRGIGPALDHHVAGLLYRDGVRRLRRLVMPWNRSARTANATAGFQLTGHFVSFGFGQRRRSILLPSLSRLRFQHLS